MKIWMKRAIRTFIQAACGYISTAIVTGIAGVTDMDTLKTVLIGIAVSSVAAGCSAVMNLKEK